MVLACVHETVWHIHANDCRPVSFNGPNHPACFYIPKPNNCNERILCYRFNDDYDGKCHYMNLPPQKTGSCLWDLLPRLSLSKSVPSKSVKTVFKVFLVLKTKYLLTRLCTTKPLFCRSYVNAFSFRDHPYFHTPVSGPSDNNIIWVDDWFFVFDAFRQLSSILRSSMVWYVVLIVFIFSQIVTLGWHEYQGENTMGMPLDIFANNTRKLQQYLDNCAITCM